MSSSELCPVEYEDRFERNALLDMRRAARRPMQNLPAMFPERAMMEARRIYA